MITLNENTILKVDRLVEESIMDTRRGNLSLMYQGLSPEERERLQGQYYPVQNAGKAALKFGALGTLGGSAGYALATGEGIDDAQDILTHGAIVGGGTGLGAGIGQYFNAKSMQQINPSQAKKDANTMRKKYGDVYADGVQAQGSKIYG